MTTNRDETQAAAWAESDERTIAADAVIHRCGDARAATNAMLADVLADDPETTAQVAEARRAGGRPSLSPDRSGPSPLWSLRVPADLDTDMRSAAAREGTDLSELIRRASTAYLAQAAAS